jgi:hypothetical protein
VQGCRQYHSVPQPPPLRGWPHAGRGHIHRGHRSHDGCWRDASVLIEYGWPFSGMQSGEQVLAEVLWGEKVWMKMRMLEVGTVAVDTNCG